MKVSSFVGFALLLLAQYALAANAPYSQTDLLKNWALSTCLGKTAKDASDRDDAYATASAYLESGRQNVDAYEAVKKLVDDYARRKYGGSIPSEFNTMKCIDLFHSQELARLVRKLTRKH